MLILVERGLQGIVDTLIHPPLRLTLTLLREVPRVHRKVSVLVNHVPNLLDTYTIKARISKHLRSPTRLGWREEM